MVNHHIKTHQCGIFFFSQPPCIHSHLPRRPRLEPLRSGRPLEMAENNWVTGGLNCNLISRVMGLLLMTGRGPPGMVYICIYIYKPWICLRQFLRIVPWYSSPFNHHLGNTSFWNFFEASNKQIQVTFTQTLNVWCMYVHLHPKPPSFVGKFTIH